MQEAARMLTALTVAAVGLAGGGTASAQTYDDGSSPYEIPASVSSHFYDIGVTQVPTAAGAPYVTALTGSSVLSLNWDFAVTATDVSTQTSTSLGNLGVPSGARITDFQYFPEWPATASTAPVYVSYSLFDASSNCYYLVMKAAQIDLTGAGNNSLGRTWFTSPCFPSTGYGDDTLKRAGGRIAPVPIGMRTKAKAPEFFLGVGDFYATKPYSISMSKAARQTLSTIVRITAPGKYGVWTKGVRNPQGLVSGRVDGKPQVLGTSQGPRGGDELYRVSEGADYGWPHRSYGTAYGPNDVPDSPDVEGTKRGYDEPLFAWTPSIGLSTMMQVQGPAFQQWWGARKNGTPDVLVSGLASRELYRVRMSQGAVRGVEALPIGARVRSLTQLPSGAIVAGLDEGSEVLVLQPTAAWSTPAGGLVPVG